MTTKRQLSRYLATLGAAVVVSLPIAAAAQTANYPGTPPPQVLGESVSRNVPAQVLGETVSRGGDALPVTGGDIAGLAALGLGSVAAGVFLVRRSRVRPT